MIYSDTIITKKGRELIAKLQVSGATTRFSSLVLGAGTDKLTEESIQLTDQRQEFELDSAKVSLDAPDKIELTASPNNIGLESGYTIREMGIYAQDPDKGNILYAVINTEDNSATYDQFPAYSGEEDYTEIIFRMEILVANAEEVTIQMSQEAIRQQIQDLEKAIDEAKNLKASLEAYGMVKLTESEAVTDSTGLALPATEKNATIEGTLANQISKLNTDIGNKIYTGKMVNPGKFPEKPSDWLISSFNIHQIEYEGDGTIDSTYPQNTKGRSYHWNVLTFGMPSRCTQIAFQAYIGASTGAENAMFIRSEHDYITTDWKQV